MSNEPRHCARLEPGHEVRGAAFGANEDFKGRGAAGAMVPLREPQSAKFPARIRSRQLCIPVRTSGIDAGPQSALRTQEQMGAPG